MRLLDVHQVLEAYPALNRGGLRHLMFNRQSNGLDRAVVRLGRKLCIDADEFDRWLEGRRERRA